MKPLSTQSSGRAHRLLRFAGAFSLIEMMVTVTLLTFIIIGLVSMFGFTQRAFRGGMTQSDVLESGRAAMDLITRDLEQTAPTSLRGVTNFMTEVYSYTSNRLIAAPTMARTNALQTFSFLVKENERWTSLGYVVALPDGRATTTGAGTLYRWQYPRAGGGTNVPQRLTNFLLNARCAYSNGVSPECSTNPIGRNLSTNFSRVCDGVVHLCVRTYIPANISTNAGMLLTRDIGTSILASTNNNTFLNPRSEVDYTFISNAVPAYVEVELGILENDSLKKYNSLPDQAKQEYLTRESTIGHIQVFRRRVAIHNVLNAPYE